MGFIENMISNAIEKDVIQKLPLNNILQGVLQRAGINMSASDVQSIISNPFVQKMIGNAAGSLTNGAPAEGQLSKLADIILAKAPNAELTKNDLVGHLKDELMKQLGI